MLKLLSGTALAVALTAPAWGQTASYGQPLQKMELEICSSANGSPSCRGVPDWGVALRAGIPDVSGSQPGVVAGTDAEIDAWQPDAGRGSAGAGDAAGRRAAGIAGAGTAGDDDDTGTAGDGGTGEGDAGTGGTGTGDTGTGGTGTGDTGTGGAGTGGTGGDDTGTGDNGGVAGDGNGAGTGDADNGGTGGGATGGGEISGGTS